MISFRSFTQSDWYTWGGCEKFPDGSDPLVGELKVEIDDKEYGAFCFVDSEGVNLVVMHDDGDEVLGIVFEDDYDARAVAMLRDKMTLQELCKLPGHTLQWLRTKESM